jgi:hypothetical protein
MPPPVQHLIDTAGSPPTEALQATVLAAAVARELYDGGREVRFALIGAPARVSARICDVDGELLSALTPARVLAIAGGAWMPGACRG